MLQHLAVCSSPFWRRDGGVRAYVRGRTCDVAIMYVLGTHILQSDCIYLDCALYHGESKVAYRPTHRLWVLSTGLRLMDLEIPSTEI